MQVYDHAIKGLKKLYKHIFDSQTAESLSPFLRQSVQKWKQDVLMFVALNCHLQRCCVISDEKQDIVGEQFAVVTWGAPTDHDKVHKGDGLQVCLFVQTSHTCFYTRMHRHMFLHAYA